MDRGWSAPPAGGTRKCTCRYCRAGCFHGSRALASAPQPLPYAQGAKKVSLGHVRRNGGYPPVGLAPGTEPGWAQRQAGRIRAWRQAEKIRAWRQALSREQAVSSGEQAEARPGGDQEGGDPGLAPRRDQEGGQAGGDPGLAPRRDQEGGQEGGETELAPRGDQPDADLALNGVCGYTELAPDSDGGGDTDLSSSSEPGNATGEQSELLSTGSEQGDLELVPPVVKKTDKTKLKAAVPTDKTWALEQAARIKAWREAKNRELNQLPDSLSVDAVTVEVENMPMNQAP